MNVSEKDKIIGQNINNLLKEHRNVSKAVQDQKNETYKNLHQKAYSRDILSNVNNQINNIIIIKNLLFLEKKLVFTK